MKLKAAVGYRGHKETPKIGSYTSELHDGDNIEEKRQYGKKTKIQEAGVVPSSRDPDFPVQQDFKMFQTDGA
jgi:hypothetical protein